MNAYLSMFLMSCRRTLAYRLSAFIGWLGGGAILICSLAVWSALIGDGAIAGYDWESMKAYLMVGWAAGAIGSSQGDWRMADRIREGHVATDLTKPVDYQSARFAEHAGGLATEIPAILIAAAAVVAITGGMPAPHNALLFLLSFAFVVPLKFCITYITTMICFWTHNYMGISWAKDGIMWLFSGGLIPFAMMPAWLAVPASLLPFAGLTATPAALYLGHATGEQAVKLLALQVFWVLTLWFGARLLWRGALKALTVHGG